jgi:nucleotide-binding universal stress UspA family protein
MSAGVIVGYDGSECAKAALRVGMELARAYGEKVVIAFAYDLNPVAGEIHDYHAAVRELAQRQLTDALAVAADAHEEDVEAVIVEKKPAAALVALAEERDARLIVVGTRGDGLVKGVLLGSTPHKLLHLSDRPVLVVPAPE